MNNLPASTPTSNGPRQPKSNPRPDQQTRKIRNLLVSTLSHGLIIFVGMYFAVPFLWMVLTAFKSVPRLHRDCPEHHRRLAGNSPANGYATAAFGKWHNTPDNESSPAGPFDRCPTGKTWGFEYFYGFMNAETHQFYPVLYRNTTPVAQPKSPEEGYHITKDLADEAIGWLNQVNATDPKQHVVRLFFHRRPSCSAPYSQALYRKV